MGLLGNSWDDPQSQAIMALAGGLLQGNFGRGATDYAQVLAGAKDRELKRKMIELQMQGMQSDMEMKGDAATRAKQLRELAGRFQTPATQGRGATGAINSLLPPELQMQAQPAIPGQPAGFDYAGYAKALAGIDPIAALELEQRISPKRKLMKIGAGDTLVDEADPSKPLFSAPQKPESMPSAVREYEYAKDQGYQGTFDQWNKETKRAGATNIGMPKIDIKMGDSVAGQVGPMLKDSRTATHGAVKMFDAADRIEKALASNKVNAGPMSSQIQTVKQLAQKIGGGNDESIRQTQQVIRSLAQMAVEARKQLQGQGQVTESEAKAVAKADAGDIDSMTTGELQDLVTLTKRASHFIAKGHQEMLDTMSSNDGTRGATPFYRVPGMETLLKHQPKLPQIGGGGDVRLRADAILGGK